MLSAVALVTGARSGIEKTAAVALNGFKIGALGHTQEDTFYG
jgi:NADP-dependent 3-hydroxy acid dehydrogenase YdfG